MTLSELKIEIIQKIIATDDVQLLMKIKETLEKSAALSNDANEPTTVYQKTEKILILNDWQQERINIALQQVENGGCISHEDDQIELEKWFQEQEK